MVNKRVPTPFAVEVLVCLQAMKAGLDLGFRRVVMEVDTLSIIKKTDLQKREENRTHSSTRSCKNKREHIPGRPTAQIRELERHSSVNVNKNKKYLKKEERLVFAKVRKKFLELKG
ncbi:hypothetical protein Golob_004377 [Gossypium lobatum]|uniref:RNase H type-1 domain-containing protein n=1 Tax=Gossypium lobatum TaxID=34289 RepID=A0A7J8N1H3_9ROSI|nr:hypothetical protein [Gossypium lobatum]